MRLRSVAERTAQVRRVYLDGGSREVGLRLARRAVARLQVTEPDIGLRPADVVGPGGLSHHTPRKLPAGQPIRVGWITMPPSAGSGGHTTMLRMVEGLEEAGHEVVLCLYDPYNGDIRRHGAELREHWPRVRASVVDVAEGLPELDAWVATSWQTAHVLASRPEASGTRFYFVQDFEPYFYPRSSAYTLAEATYRFGFHGITAGGWIADVLKSEYGMTCDAFEFGVDHDRYHLQPAGPRDGVVFYAKPDVPRRAYLLGILALERFAEEHPEAPIHLFGADVGRLPFPAVSHGVITPTGLGALYNTCRVGLSLSMSNVSLIPWELMACGAIPVVNDAPHNRQVLTRPMTSWAKPTPASLAAALSGAYEINTTDALAAAVSASVADATWSAASDIVVAAIERNVWT